VVALKTHHPARVVRQPIDQLAFTFIAPLGSYNHYIFCHRFRKLVWEALIYFEF
jgi:hypothetical protein